MTRLLEVRGVSIAFGGLVALQDVSVHVDRGSIVGVLGPNGAGKTTLFNVISGFLAPSTGTVRLAGKDITGRRPSRICRMGLARTFQITRPFPGLSVLETVRIGALNRAPSVKAATRAARETLERVGLAHKQAVLGKYLTVMERKRLEVARALAAQPSIILLDEVAAGLRPQEIVQISQLIKSIAEQGVAILMIEHVMEAILSVAHRILVLSHGQLLAEGLPEDMMRDSRVVEAYLGSSGCHDA